MMAASQSSQSTSAASLPQSRQHLTENVASPLSLTFLEHELEKYGSWSTNNDKMQWLKEPASSMAEATSSSSEAVKTEAGLENCQQNLGSLASIWDTPPIQTGDVLPDLFNLAVQLASVSDTTASNDPIFNGFDDMFNNGVASIQASGAGTRNSAVNASEIKCDGTKSIVKQQEPFRPELINKWLLDGDSSSSSHSSDSATLNFVSPGRGSASSHNTSVASPCTSYVASPCTSYVAEGYPARSHFSCTSANSTPAATPTRVTDGNFFGTPPFRMNFTPNGSAVNSPRDSNKWRAVGSPPYSSPTVTSCGSLNKCGKFDGKPKLLCRNLNNQWAMWPTKNDAGNPDPNDLRSSSGETTPNKNHPNLKYHSAAGGNNIKEELGQHFTYEVVGKENFAAPNNVNKTNVMNQKTERTQMWRQPLSTLSCANLNVSSNALVTEQELKEYHPYKERSVNAHSVGEAPSSYPNETYPAFFQSHQAPSPLNNSGASAAQCFATSNVPPNLRTHYNGTFLPNLVMGPPERPALPHPGDRMMPAAQQQLQPFPCRGQNAELVSLMQELAVVQNIEVPAMQLRSPPAKPSAPVTDVNDSPNKGCVFCKNNGYHSTFYKAHSLKDERGFCTCPVLRTYVCPLCGSSGNSAHTLKYCPFNTVTGGDPVAAGLPPGKVTNWRNVAHMMAVTSKPPPADIFWRP
ncbi:uncharacterized protein LOC108675289 [Hyalella azteca]|uniref:Uncharacterized protein LOC108675289 n=1 Tax=Hyalella azteca TaxID=294128 RepID=A0A8B7NY91_HYAAZ|nr:uncharacterized protein LOC108675289 [Hyalella azteca]XP_047737608.1 uncharacterized protein LOC108675289 [Hyalella azteca]